MRNIVKKHMHRTSRPVTHRDRKKDAKKGYRKHKERLR
jgi:hypothetical protein